MTRPPFPFSALVGQPDLTLALLLNAVSPAVGGVLVRGEKGTAKSTAVRGLARLLPQIQVVDGCPYNCDPQAPDPDCPAGPHPHGAPGRGRAAPLVELPVGASTDRVAGALDLERALTEGRRGFEPGLLAAAHRGILYVDEVNLLNDHLVDVLLDVAAMGTNYVERESSDGTTLALDLGAGAQRVTEWSGAPGSWSPSFHGWTQVVRPLSGRFALGTELEAYDARVSTDAPSATRPVAQWWYGSASIWLRATF